MIATAVQLRTSTLNRIDAVDNWLRRREPLIVCCLLAWIAGIGSLYAALKPLWLDEYLSVITQSTSSPAAIWRILHDAPLAVDPPLYHVLTQFILVIFGNSEFHARLLSVAAYTASAGFLYAFVRRYSEFYVALLAPCLLFVCGSFRYASEDRPYATVLAAAAAAVYFWSGLAWSKRARALALLGLWLALAVGVAAHWYGFFILLPVAAGQVARDVQSRRVDFKVWAVIVSACLPILTCLSLLKAAAAYRALPWSSVTFWYLPYTLNFILEPCIAPLVFAAIGIFVLRAVLRPEPFARIGTAVWPVPVLVCAIVLACMPIEGFVAAKLVTHVLMPRYVMSGALGLIVLFCIAFEKGAGQNIRSAGVAVLIVCLYACPVLVRTGLSFRHANQALSGQNAPFANERKLPIVISNLDMFMQLEDRAPAAIKRRCVYVSDPESVSVLHQNTTFLSSEAIKRWTAAPIIDLPALLRQSRRFYLVGPVNGSVGDWLLDWLLKEHSRADVQGSYDDASVFLADTSNIQESAR